MKQKNIVVEGVVVETLPNAIFRVKLNSDHIITCHISGKMRQANIRVIDGDKVKVEMSPYDMEKGRITYRYK